MRTVSSGIERETSRIEKNAALTSALSRPQRGFNKAVVALGFITTLDTIQGDEQHHGQIGKFQAKSHFHYSMGEIKNSSYRFGG